MDAVRHLKYRPPGSQWRERVRNSDSLVRRLW
jgi:hypothetical protein